MKSITKRFISLLFLLILSIDLISCKFLEKNLASKYDDYEIIYVIKTDDESAFREAIDKLNQNGGFIIVNTTVVSISNNTKINITSTTPGGIIGVIQPNGEYPRLDFKGQRNYAPQYPSALYIFGSNQFIKYLIIENSAYNGISILGHQNTIDHVITRYNFCNGIEIHKDANANIINHCYSYRNCGWKTFGSMGNGFSHLGATNNIYSYCFAWDNSNNGFHSYVYGENEVNSTDITYLHSASWNNGGFEVFIGKYDYDNGKPLDKNLYTIQEIMKSDENFESNYNNKKFNVENATIDEMDVLHYCSMVNGVVSGNGFEFGSKYPPNGNNYNRTAEYSVAFDQKGKGFDNYNKQKYIGYFSNCVGFNNNMNYLLPYTFAKWENNWSWGAKKGDEILLGTTTKKPNNENTAKRIFYSIRDQIIKSVTSNTFPESINFDIAIKSLKE